MSDCYLKLSLYEDGTPVKPGDIVHIEDISFGFKVVAVNPSEGFVVVMKAGKLEIVEVGLLQDHKKSSLDKWEDLITNVVETDGQRPPRLF